MAKISKENAAEVGAIGGRKSAEARAARKALRGDQQARARFESAANQMAGIILKAAKGEDEFKSLTPKDRATFAVKALEYGMGRARAMADEAAPPEEPKGGLSFGVRDVETTEGTGEEGDISGG